MNDCDRTDILLSITVTISALQPPSPRPAAVLAILTFAGLAFATAFSAQIVFFAPTQQTNLVLEGTTSDTLESTGYLFTVTRDKLFTGGIGLTNPIGRYLRVSWPSGLEAQAVTAGPNPGGARCTVARKDGQPFAIEQLTFRLLANTAGAGGALEIMPTLGGEDGFPDPLMLDATGYAGSQFTYSTPALTGFDTYNLALYVDFAVMQLTVLDSSPEPPVLSVEWIASDLIRLSWTTTAAFTLESTPTFPALNWTAVTSEVVVQDGTSIVDVQPTATSSLFRLRQ